MSSVALKRTSQTANKGKFGGKRTREQKIIQAKAVAAQLIANPTMSAGAAIRAAGLSEYAAGHPSVIVKDTTFIELLDQYLPQGEILETHRGLLKAASIDHMIFADGPRDEISAENFLAEAAVKGTVMTREDILTDDDIREILKEKNCEVRRITRTERSRHVYFWSPDSRARKDALDMAYKLRGSYAADKAAVAFSLASLAKLRDDSDATPRLPSRSTPLIAAVDDDD